MSRELFAAQEAAKWKAGLADWGQDAARIERLRQAAGVVLYTPGSKASQGLIIELGLCQGRAPLSGLSATAEPWLLAAVDFLALYKRLIFGQHLWTLVGATLGVFVNLFALADSLTRRLFLKDTGRKLAQVDRQLQTGDTIVRDLSDRLERDE